MVRTHWKGNADMTPINPTASSGLPEYARQDVVRSGVGTAPIDAGSTQSIDPSQPGYVDASAYSNAAMPDTYGVDPYAAPYEAAAPESAYGSAVAGMQPATTQALPDATLADFAQLGIFTEQELGQLAQMNMPAQEMNALFDEAVKFMQSPEFAQLQAQQQAIPTGEASVAGGEPQWNDQWEKYYTPGVQSPAESPAATDPNVADVANGTAAPSGPPAWNGEWAVKFRDVMDEQGLDSKTQLMVIASLRQAPLGEAELTQALEYYSTTPEGKAELQAANEQVKAGAAMQDKMLLTFGAGALGIGGVAGAIGASKGNLVKALEHTVTAGGDRGAAAARALDEIKAGRPLTTAMRAEIAATLRGEAGATSRLRSPITKMSLNGGARHVTPGTPLSFKDAMKYGLWMKSGDGVADAAAGAATAGRTAEAVKAGGIGSKVAAATGAGDDVTRAVAGSVDEVSKAAGGAAQAAKGASMLGKVGKVLGPVGLALSAGVGIWGISKTVEAEGGFGKESAKMTGNVAGGLAGGVAGAAGGAAIGSLILPVVGTGIGAVVGGIAGSIGLGKIGESVGGFIHGLFD